MIRRIRAALHALATGALPDDLMALAEATRETYPTIRRDEPTPIADAALAAAVARECAIEAAVEDWRAEVAACADAELTELIEGEL